MYPGNSTGYVITAEDIDVGDTFDIEVDLGDASGFVSSKIDSSNIEFIISPGEDVKPGTY